MIYVGGYGDAISLVGRGSDGRLRVVGEAKCPQASFLAWHPRLPRLYAVNEGDEGTVTTLEVRGDGSLATLAVHPTEGALPCYLEVRGDVLAVANYGGGSLATYRLGDTGVPSGPPTVTRFTGSGPDLERQAGPHAHMVVHPGDGLRYVVDLGTDQIHRHGPGGWLPPVRLRTGSGPRHIAGDGQGHWYVAGELDGGVASYRDRGDEWQEIEWMPASRDSGPNSLSHIALVGRHLYVGNRGPDTLSVFEAEAGRLRLLKEVSTEGHWPRHFAIFGDVLYVADQNSDEVACFDLNDGIPDFTGEKLTVPQPSCVVTGP